MSEPSSLEFAEPAQASARSWAEIARQAVLTDAIRLVAVNAPELPVAQYSYTERVRLELDLAGFPLSYALVIAVDGEQVTCLCPSAMAPDCRIPSGKLTIPHLHGKAGLTSLIYRGAKGRHSLYAILTNSKLPYEAYRLLGISRDRAVLDKITRLLPSDDVRVLKTEFEVVE